MTKAKIQLAAFLMKDKHNTVTEICQILGVSRATLYRYVTPQGEGPVRVGIAVKRRPA